MDKVLREVFPAKAKWKFIGIELGVPIGEVDAIESMGSDFDDKLMRTLTKWLRRGNNTTWKALAKAMGAVTVERIDKGKNISKPHLVDTSYALFFVLPYNYICHVVVS